MKPLLIILFGFTIAQAQTLKPGIYRPKEASFGGIGFALNEKGDFCYYEFSCTGGSEGTGYYTFHDSILELNFIAHPFDTLHPKYTFYYESQEQEDSITISFSLIDNNYDKTREFLGRLYDSANTVFIPTWDSREKMMTFRFPINKLPCQLYSLNFGKKIPLLYLNQNLNTKINIYYPKYYYPGLNNYIQYGHKEIFTIVNISDDEFDIVLKNQKNGIRYLYHFLKEKK